MKKIVIGVGLGLVAVSQAQAWNGGVEDMRTMHANEKEPVVRVKSVQVSVWQGQRYQHSAAAHQCNTKGLCHGGWRAVKKANYRVASQGAVCGPHSSTHSAVVPRPHAKRVVKQVNQPSRAQRQAYYAAQQKRKALQLAQKRRAAQIAQQQRQAALQRQRQQAIQQKAVALQKQRIAQQKRQAALKRQALLLQKQRILQQQRLLAAKKQMLARKRAQMQQMQARRVVRPHYRHHPATRVHQGYQACGVRSVQVFRPAPRPQVRQVVRQVQVVRPVVRYVQRPVQQVIVHRPVRPIYSQQIAPVFTGSMVFGGGGNGYVGISTDGSNGGGNSGTGGGHNGHGGMGGGHNGKGNGHNGMSGGHNGHGGMGGGHNGKGNGHNGMSGSHGSMNVGHSSGMGGGGHGGMSGGGHKGHSGMGGGHGGMSGGHGGGDKGMHGSKGMQGVKGSFGALAPQAEPVTASACSGWQASSCVSTQHVKRSKQF